MGLNFTINNELVVPYSRYMQGFCFKQTLITFLLMGRLPSVHRLWSLYHNGFNSLLKFIYSEKATKFCEISTLLLSYVVPVKSKVKISQNFVAFSEYMNFTEN